MPCPIITPDDFTRIGYDYCGNPRWICHYLWLGDTYAIAEKHAAAIGGKKLRSRKQAGMLVFKGDVRELCSCINAFNAT